LLKNIPKYLLWFLPFLIIDIALITYGFNTFSLKISPILIAEYLKGVFININITMAIFAVNFSFLSFPFFTYRSLPKKVTLIKLLHHLHNHW